MSWFRAAAEFVAPTVESDSPGAPQLFLLMKQCSTTDARKRCLRNLKNAADRSTSSHEDIGKEIPYLISLLRLDADDDEVLGDILEILYAVIQIKDEESSDAYVQHYNAQMFIEDESNVVTVVDLLENSNFYVILCASRLLIALMATKKEFIQDLLQFKCPMGVSRIIDLLAFPTESVRNEGLLLLSQVTDGCQPIQKIVAFQGVFENLVAIIEAEGGVDGGIIVCDCIRLINTLLRRNDSNQNYFRETGCMRWVPKLLELDYSDSWLMTDQKQKVLLHTLETVALLVSPANPSSYNNQVAMGSTGALARIADLALNKINFPAIRMKALCALIDIIRDCPETRESFGSHKIDVEGSSQSCLSRLLVIASQSPSLAQRIGALQTFQAHLHHNEDGQLLMASTLTPPPDSGVEGDGPSEEIGRVLLDHYLGWKEQQRIEGNCLKAWFSVCMLSYMVRDNERCKELVLRIPLSIPKAGEALMGPSSVENLLHRTIAQLHEAHASCSSIGAGDGHTPPLMASSALMCVGVLRLLACWIDGCPAAGEAFFHVPTSLSMLVELVSSSLKGMLVQSSHQSDAPATDLTVHIQGLSALLMSVLLQGGDEAYNKQMTDVVLHRIGLDQFIRKMKDMFKSPAFQQAEQGTTLAELCGLDGEGADGFTELQSFGLELLYDYDFTVFARDVFDMVSRQLRAIRGGRPTPMKKSSSRLGSDRSTPLNGSPGGTPGRGTDDVASVELQTELQGYKDLVKLQDKEMKSLKEQLAALQSASSSSSIESSSTPQALTPSTAAEEAHDGGASSASPSSSELEKALADAQSHAAAKQEELEAAKSQIQRYEADLSGLSLAYNELEQQLQASVSSTASHTPPPPSPSAVSAALARAERAEVVLKELRKEKATLDATLVEKSGVVEALQVRNDELSKRVSELELRVSHHQEEKNGFEARVKQLESTIESRAPSSSPSPTPGGDGGSGGEAEDSSHKVAELECEVEKLSKKVKQEQARFIALEEEQEELLVILANTEIENSNLQERLRIKEAMLEELEETMQRQEAAALV